MFRRDPPLTRKVASHVAVSPKRGPGRPPKTTIEPAATVKETPGRRTGTLGFTPSTRPVAGPSSVKSYTGKRKQSIGSQPYAEPKPDTETLRKRRKSTPGKTVNFVDVVDEDNDDSAPGDGMNHVITSRVKFPTPESSSKKTKADAKGKGKAPAKSVVKKPVVDVSESGESEHVITSRVRFDGSQTRDKGKGEVVKKTSKAAAAGQAIKKRNDAKTETKGNAVGDVRTTRSGARYTL